MTFQRFNGDDLNPGLGWTEGYPIVYQPPNGSLENKNHPMTSIAYFRVYWKFIEPESGKYRWDLIDTALKTATSRRQTLLLRIAPYGTEASNDVPTGTGRCSAMRTKCSPIEKWRTNPEDPRYVESLRRNDPAIRVAIRRPSGRLKRSTCRSWGPGAKVKEQTG